MSTFGNPEKVKLGRCKLIEEVMIGEDKVSTVLVCEYCYSVYISFNIVTIICIV